MITAVSLAVMTLAFLIWKKFHDFFEEKPKIFVFFRISLLILTFLISIHVLGLFGIFYVLIITSACFIGMFNSHFDLDYTVFLAFGILNVSQIIIFFILSIEYDASSNVWVCFLFCVIYLLHSNQNNINFLMERRSHKLEQLPSKIRRYNLLLVIASLAIIIICFSLREYVVAFFAVIGKVIVIILRWFFYSDEEYVEAETTTESQESSSSSLADLLGGSEGNDSYDKFFFTLFFLLTAFYLFDHRKAIAQAFKDFANKIVLWFVKLFGDKAIQKYKENQIEEAYSDEVEELEREGILKGLRKEKKYNFKMWKKEYKAFTKIKDENNKAEIGYRLIIKWLNLNGEDVKTSETPLEIYTRTEKVLSFANWNSTTQTFNLFKYAEKEANTNEIEKICDLISKNKTNVK